MLTVERQQEILRLLAMRGSAGVIELARLLSVTEQTIRRDLSRLEEEGRLTRSHGGAVLTAGGGDVPFSLRLVEAADEKGRIGAVAASLVEPGETVILDAGTTTLAVARALGAKPGLRAVTNAVPIASELVTHADLDVILVGGQLRTSTLSTVGTMAREAYQRLHADKLFLAAGGIDPQRGLTNSNLVEAEIKQAMMAAATEIYVVAHGVKVGRSLMYTFAAVNAVKALITTRDASAEMVFRIRSLGVEVILA